MSKRAASSLIVVMTMAALFIIIELSPDYLPLAFGCEAFGLFVLLRSDLYIHRRRGEDNGIH